MDFKTRYLALRDDLWQQFEALVKVGAHFPQWLTVTYPKGENPSGLSKTTEGDSWFFAIRLLPDPNFVLHVGEDLIVDTNPVTFVDVNGKKHLLKPDILDLYWLSEILDEKE